MVYNFSQWYLGNDVEAINAQCSVYNGVDSHTCALIKYKSGAVADLSSAIMLRKPNEGFVYGTKGYAYVPSPWWKTDYFELRYEDQNRNKKYFYSWNEPGLRYEIQEFVSCVVNGRQASTRLTPKESICMARIMGQFGKRKNFYKI